MKLKYLFSTLSVLILLLAGVFSYVFLFKNGKQKSADIKGGVGDFVLLDHQGDIQKLYLYSNAKAIVIVGFGNDCPIIQRYSEKIDQLNRQYSKEGVVFLMIDPNTQDTRDTIIAEAREYHFNIPIMMDRSQIVTRALGLTRTSEVVVITPNNWQIVYRGGIDDRVGFEVDKRSSKNEALANVLNQILSNKNVQVNPIAAKGCAFTFHDINTVISYEKQIAPIIENKCLSCHSSVASFKPTLNSYEKIHGWATMIKETLMTDRMPPFSADTHYGKYKNDISLKPEEKRLLMLWIEQGMPRKNREDPLPTFDLRRARERAELKKKHDKAKPIYQVSMPFEQEIPPEGFNQYKFYQMGGPIPRDMWVREIRTTPKSPRQLHHQSIYIVSKPMEFYEKLKTDVASNKDPYRYFLGANMEYYERDKNENYLSLLIWGGGRPSHFKLSDGSALFLPKGYYLVLETHYMGIGKPDSDQTKIEFFGSTYKPNDAFQLKHSMLLNTTFEIPPMVKKYKVTTKPYVVKKDLNIRMITGHMHARGRSIKLIQQNENNKPSQIIASIPNYYFKWQIGSGLIPEKPIFVRAGSKLVAECEFDNSPENPNNPDSNISVKFGHSVDKSDMCLLTFVRTDAKGLK